MHEVKTQVDHSARKHALLSASGASKWINCTPSPRLEETMPHSSSSYADEGTLAHEFAELNLKLQLGLMPKLEHGEATFHLKKDKYYSTEMEDYVQIHVDYVKEQFAIAQANTRGAVLMIEEKVDMTHLIKDGFGTCDDIIVADGVMEVIDLKFGAGVRVSAENNSQLKLYALGALRLVELSYAIHTVRLTVVQPRMDSISNWDISVEDLLNWGDDVVIPKAIEAHAGEGETKIGEWCRFCKVKHICKAQANNAMSIAKHEFADPKLIDPDTLLDVYDRASTIISWLNSVTDHVYKEALNGTEFKGFKLVEGRANRKIVKPEEVEQILTNEGYVRHSFITEKLKGIGELEKLVGKKNFDLLLGGTVDKPKGLPALVPNDDPRPTYNKTSAADDFNNDDDLLL